MLSPSFPAPLTATTTFSGETVTPPPCHVRFRQILAFATANATEASSTRSVQQPRPSCLSPHSMACSLYEILGIGAAASDQEIKAAYRRLARVSHPDVAAVDRKDSSAGEFMKIHAAYSTLSDPEKRASYDRSLFQRRQPLTMAAASRFSGYAGRKWETDQCW